MKKQFRMILCGLVTLLINTLSGQAKKQLYSVQVLNSSSPIQFAPKVEMKYPHLTKKSNSTDPRNSGNQVIIKDELKKKKFDSITTVSYNQNTLADLGILNAEDHIPVDNKSQTVPLAGVKEERESERPVRNTSANIKLEIIIVD